MRALKNKTQVLGRNIFIMLLSMTILVNYVKKSYATSVSTVLNFKHSGH